MILLVGAGVLKRSHEVFGLSNPVLGEHLLLNQYDEAKPTQQLLKNDRMKNPVSLKDHLPSCSRGKTCTAHS